MKNVFFSGCIAICLMLLSCNEKSAESGVSEKAKKNLEANRAITAAIRSGDVSKLDQYIAADAIDHSGMHGDIVGTDSIKQYLGKVHNMATDFKMETIREVADDEYVFEWMKVSGKAANSEMGMPAGTAFSMNAVQVSRFKDGKAVEHWEFMLPKEMMANMPQAPVLGPDTTRPK